MKKNNKNKIKSKRADKNTNNELIENMMKNRTIRTSITKESHYWFFHFYMGTYVKYETAPFQKEMFNITEGSDPLVVVSAFRGSAKSTIFTLSYPIWAILGKMQKKFVVILSQNQHQVKRHFINLRKELESNKLLAQDLGPFKEDVDEWGVSSLSISNYDAKIVAASFEQNIRGIRHKQYRPDLIIVDDIEDFQSVKTQEGRDKTYQWFKGDIVPTGSEETRIVVLGTPLHDYSLIKRLEEEISTGITNGVYKSYPIIDHTGKSLWPGRFPNKESVEKEKKKIGDERMWTREFLLKILPEDYQVIHPDWIQYYDALPEKQFSGYRYSAIGVDLAISESTTSDFTAMVAGSIYGQRDNLRIYILPNSVNKKLDFPNTVKMAEGLSKSIGAGIPARIFVESVGYQKSTIDQLRYHGYPAEEYRPQGNDKRSRLAMTTHLIQSGQILFPRKGAEKLISQLVGFGRERYDDLVDAFTALILKIIEKENTYSEYSQLITREKLEEKYIEKVEVSRAEADSLRIGVVMAGSGRPYSVAVIKGINGAKVFYHSSTTNIEEVAEAVTKVAKEYDVLPTNIYIETFGMGKFLYDALDNRITGYHMSVVPISLGGEVDLLHEAKDFDNARSSAFWRIKMWLERGGGKLERNIFFDGLADIEYKTLSDKKMRVKAIDEMLKEGLASPDTADALALVFARSWNPFRIKPFKQAPYVATSEYEGGIHYNKYDDSY